MPNFHHGDVEIAYLDEGEGEPILLVHGFASSKNVNWAYPGWVSELKRLGRRVIALDNRGHGESSKLYDSAQYEIAIMASDIIALMDHLDIARADVMGYSLGSRMTAVLALDQPQRLRSIILGGIGIGMITGGGPGENVAKALEAADLGISAAAVRDEYDAGFGASIAVRALLPLVEQTDRMKEALGACVEYAKINESSRAYVGTHGERVLDAGLAELAAREAAKPKPKYVVEHAADGSIRVKSYPPTSKQAIFSGPDACKYADAHVERLNAEAKP